MPPPDRPEVLFHKARQDELVVERLLGDRDVDDDTLGFHAQQAAEKLLKAVLTSRNVDYPRTHNLGVLVELLASNGIELPAELADIDRLTPFGTVFRYDEVSPEAGRDRALWLAWVRALREFAQSLIR
jgi:HEPN domain-containing protein